MRQTWPAIMTLGWILLAVAAGETGIALFSLAVGDGLADLFIEDAAITALAGGAAVLTTHGRVFELRFRDATLLTVLSWFVVPAFVALPFMAEPASLSAVNAYFEAVSGLTTTGSTVMIGLDELPPSLLLWRSFSQWLGGIGIIGFAIVILPFLKIGGMQLFRLESSDRSEKAMPRARQMVVAVLEIYVALTLACFMAYWLLGMSSLDALNHAMTTLPTGGFSTHDASFGYFDSPALKWAAVTFMILGSLPFLTYVRLLQRGSLKSRRDPQAETFLVALAIGSVVFALWLFASQDFGLGAAITESTFNIVSVVTTTGYASVDYLKWGTLAAAFFFLLTFVGGCTGSTAGGLKIFRFQVVAGMVSRHMGQAIHPHAVRPLRYAGRLVTDDQVGSVSVFVFVYLATVMVVTLALALLGLDPETALSGAATAVGNVGPGIGPVIGPAGNFAALPDAAKLILSAAMVMGRLELLSVLLLLSPTFYR